ncbi:uncharacterized protein LOC144451389 [Glandiceps talaboti]
MVKNIVRYPHYTNQIPAIYKNTVHRIIKTQFTTSSIARTTSVVLCTKTFRHLDGLALLILPNDWVLLEKTKTDQMAKYFCLVALLIVCLCLQYADSKRSSFRSKWKSLSKTETTTNVAEELSTLQTTVTTDVDDDDDSIWEWISDQLTSVWNTITSWWSRKRRDTQENGSLEETNSMFDTMDVDGDGFLGFKEWILPVDTYFIVLEKFDEDGDGKLAYDEFIAFRVKGTQKKARRNDKPSGE